MDITLLYFDGCPNWTVARDRLAQALGVAHLEDCRLSLRRISSPEEADEARFAGSPTVLIDGRDPFGDDQPAGALACRIYDTPSGPQGAPTLVQLVDALTAAAAGGTRAP